MNDQGSLNEPQIDIMPVAGMKVLDIQNQTIGEVEGVFCDRLTMKPEWIRISAGRLNKREVMAPLDGISQEDGALVLPYPENQVMDAPQVEDGDVINYQDERKLYEHYHVLRILPGDAEERQEKHDEVSKQGGRLVRMGRQAA